MNRRVTPSIVFAVTIVCAIALGRPAWSQDQPLSRSIVSDTNPQHKAHISFTVKAEQAYRAQVLGNAAPKIGGAPTNAPILYNGGPVMRNPTNYLIFWQPPNNPNTFPAGFQPGSRITLKTSPAHPSTTLSLSTTILRVIRFRTPLL